MYDGDQQTGTKYFYLHDRLGSVRSLTNATGDVKNTYSPFGEAFSGECVANADNPFMFTGQWFDDEIQQYYLRARMYDPALMLFTSRDPVKGEYKEPLTLHKYLYCLNNPINRVDPTGRASLAGTMVSSGIVGGLIRGAFGALQGKDFGKSFAEGFAFGALGGGLASLSAAGFFAMNFAGEIGSAIMGAGVGNSLAGGLEGLYRNETMEQISERMLWGMTGGILGKVFSGSASAFRGLDDNFWYNLGGSGAAQFLQGCVDYFRLFENDGSDER